MDTHYLELAKTSLKACLPGPLESAEAIEQATRACMRAWRQRRERKRHLLHDAATSIGRFTTPNIEQDPDQWPNFELIGLSYPLTHLRTLTSAQLAVRVLSSSRWCSNSPLNLLVLNYSACGYTLRHRLSSPSKPRPFGGSDESGTSRRAARLHRRVCRPSSNLRSKR